jgi:gliding motility-associated-like protein
MTTTRYTSYRYLLLSILFLSASLNLHATHIIGGELTYTCLGNNRYEVLLTVYRDCYTGRPPFDSPAYIGIYGSNNILIDSIKIERSDTLKLDPKLNDTCLIVPPNVCVSTTTYRDTITLLPRPGGYILAYQRCCRNQSILNIIKPLDSGATFMIAITEDAIMACNSSAKFKDWPPIYICVNKPLVFDQSAVDIDGDSVHYRLCTPLLGGTTIVPQPQPATPPPYKEVNWKAPYGLNNVLGGDPLKIDPKTGLLTAVPNTIGQFVVGICIEEFRKGKLISTTRRDFQFNVGICGKSVSSIFAPTFICDQTTVFFENKSLNSNRFSWDFGDPDITNDISDKKNPAWVYSDTGTYRIRLITQPNSVCADTSYRDVTLRNSSLQADFNFEIKSCEDSLILALSDTSRDSLNKKIVKYEWEAFLGLDTLKSTLKNPTFHLKRYGLWYVRLTVTSENGCPKTIEREILADLIDLNLPDTLRGCPGEKVQLNPNGDPSLTYVWSPAADFSDPKAPQQQATVSDKEKIYTVKLDNKACTANRKIYVLPDANVTKLDIKVNPDTILYGKTTQLFATEYPTSYKYQWEPANSLNNSKISNPFASPTETTLYTVTVKSPNSLCDAKAQARVYVIIPDCGEPYIYLPNAFTPNDDGNNDIFEVRGIAVTGVKLWVYNRWGERVFSSEGATGGWDGYFGNILCPPDVYGYYLEVTCLDGQVYTKKGNVTLIR